MENQEIYNLVRDTFHDDNHNCENIASLIKTHFKGENPEQKALMHFAVDALKLRAMVGRNFMDLLYKYEAVKGN